MVTDDCYFNLLICFVEHHASTLLNGSVTLRLLLVGLVGIDRWLFYRSTVGSFVDQLSARSPVIESTIE
jgi:hypothetical protein